MNEEEFLRKHPSLKGKDKTAGTFNVYTAEKEMKLGRKVPLLFYDKDIHETQLDKQKVKEVIEKLKTRFGARPKPFPGEKQDRFISYLDLKKELGLE